MKYYMDIIQLPLTCCTICQLPMNSGTCPLPPQCHLYCQQFEASQLPGDKRLKYLMLQAGKKKKEKFHLTLEHI